jgi:DNA repair photolyase
MANKFEQGALFDESVLGRPLPTVGEQKDIRYYGTIARTVLNGPETTGMGFWSINPYVGCAFGCAYCYARYAHRYSLDRHATANPEHGELQTARDDMPFWLAFERRIFVKQNAADVLRKVLRHGSDRHLALLRGETIVIGTATDPFQPAERRFRITRSVLEVLADHPGLSVCIITKSPLITRTSTTSSG